MLKPIIYGEKSISVNLTGYITGSLLLPVGPSFSEGLKEEVRQKIEQMTPMEKQTKANCSLPALGFPGPSTGSRPVLASVGIHLMLRPPS